MRGADLDGVIARLNAKFAQAHAEIDAFLNDTGRATEILTFVPLAAKSQTTELPEEVTSTDDDSIVVAISPEDGMLQVSIDALGFTRANELEGRKGHFSSLDGVISYDFQFDATAHARIVIADTEAARRALLRGWRLLLAR